VSVAETTILLTTGGTLFTSFDTYLNDRLSHITVVQTSQVS